MILKISNFFSYFLQKLYRPYELQLQGLNFLPGTDIVPMAVEQKIFTEEEINNIMYAPMNEQFGAYWQRKTTRESELWYEMIYCLQFKCFEKKLEKYEENPQKYDKQIDNLYNISQKLFKLRYVYKKVRIVLKRMFL